MPRFLSILLVLSYIHSGLFAQTEREIKPRSWLVKQPLARLVPELLPSFDLQRYLREDSINQAYKIGPWRFAHTHQVQYNLDNAGTWDALPSGDRIWRMQFHSPSALTMNLIFNQFELPEGASLHIYNRERTEYLGAYSSKNNNAENMLGTELINGDYLTVEYYEPRAARGQGRLQIGSVMHGYKSLNNYAANMLKALNDAGKCNHDVNCPLGNGWQDQINSVALIVVNGSGACTGSLINNTSEDGTPYFLTADHCMGGNVATWVFRFNWDSPTPVCAANAPSASPPTPFNSVNGAITRAQSGGSDMALLELNAAPTGDIYYAGWDRSGVAPPFTVGIHHPSGDVKKICRDDDSPLQAIWGGAQTWHVVNWEDGVTEPGSSGSALFDHNKRIIGQLYGGSAACTNRTSTTNNGAPDYYGRFDVSWTGGGTNATRLSNWLDPINTSALALDGYDPNTPTAQRDGALTALTGINDKYCGTATIDAEVLLRNSGIDPLTTVDFVYGLASGATQNYQWTGSLASGATTTVNLPQLSVSTSGLQTLGVTITNVNGQSDTVINNNVQTFEFFVMANGVATEFTLDLDCYGDETTWELLIPSQGNYVFEEGGPYTLTATPPTINQTFCLDPGCYVFAIYDDYGDGLNGAAYTQCGIDGNYFILSSVGDTLVQMGAADFGDSTSHYFCTTVPGPPTASFTLPSNTDICEGSSISFTNTSSSATSYQWILPGATPAVSSDVNPTLSYASPGSYDVELIATNSIGSETFTIPSAITVHANSLALSGQTNPSTGGMSNGSVSVQASGGQAPLSYLWNTGATTSDLNGVAAGSYELTVTDAYGCQVSQSFTVTDLALSLTEQELLARLELFPNPTTGLVQVSWSLAKQSDVELSVYDARGRLLQVWQHKNSQEQIEALDLSAYSSGLYLLRLRTSEGEWTKKIIRR